MAFERLAEFFASIGMGDPAMRFLGTGAAAAGLFWLIKPSLMFDAKGDPRSFGGPPGTYVPWYVGAVAVGSLFALFL